MISTEEAKALGERLNELHCTNDEAGDGLFTYVMNREPREAFAHYESHLRECEHCRVALEIYRYKRDVAQLLGRKDQQDKRP